jgi:uncharacterized protein (DUF1501 family)
MSSLKQGRLVVVFLRGAYDGLSATIPYADAEYQRLRPSIAIPAPDGTHRTSIKLDETFALHQSLAPLLPMWRDGVLAFVPASGSPDPTRSHFEAQTHWEIGMPGKSNAPRGWLNALAGITAGTERSATGIGVGDANPKILSGPATVLLIPRGKAAASQGTLANQRTREALLGLYGGDDEISQAFRQGADSRMSSTKQLADEEHGAQRDASAVGLPLDARHLGTLMRNDRKLRVGFLSAGGWDTHANQGAFSGGLAKNFGSLAAALVQLRRDFSEPGDIIIVASEFGRTCAENGTRGTDHGNGNTLWLIGNRIAGGRWHGTWSGLSAENLHEGRDIPVHHDFRSIFAQVLQSGFGLRDSQLQDVFPGASDDLSLGRMLLRS